MGDLMKEGVMKRKTLNKLFAAATAGFLFTNASIAANAEELPEDSGVVSEQNVSGKEAGETEESGGEQASGQSSPSEAEPDRGNGGEAAENVQPAEQQPFQPAGQQPEQPEGQEPEQQPSQPAGESPESQNPDQSQGQQPEAQPVEQNPEQQPSQSAGQQPEQPEGQEPETQPAEQKPEQQPGQPEAGDGRVEDDSENDKELPGQPETEGAEGDREPSGPESSGVCQPGQQGPEQAGGDGTQAGTEEDTPQITGPSNFEEAKENLEKAEAEEEQAKAELDKAQAEADSAKEDVDKAGQETQEAGSALDTALDKKQEAEAEKEKADGEVSKTEQAVSEAEKKLDQALEDAAVDKDAYDKVQQDLDAKKDALDTAEKEASSAEAEYNEKKTAAEEAAAEAEKLQSALAVADSEKQAAEAELSVSRQEQTQAQKEYDQALKENAGAGMEKQNLDKAQAELDAAQEKVASGSLGFFQYLAGQGSGSAGEAVTILTAKDKSEVKGLGNESNWTAQSWEQFTSYTKIGDENDATSLENMRRAIAFIRECNELRMADGNFPGLSALVVNDAMMAIAQLNANWATYNPDGTFNSHSKVFNAGENLAWYYLDVPGMTDPFQGWYYEEKKNFDNKTGGVTGHYENIVNGSYSATGFGINLSEKSGDIRLNCAQEFSNASLMEYYSYGLSYSVDEYEARFMSYYNSVMKRLSDAQAAYNAAKDAYDKEVAAGTVTGGEATDISAKKAELDKATARLEAAKASAEEKLEKFNEVQSAYNAGIQKNEAAQAAFGQSRVNYENTQKNLQQAQEAYGALCKEIEDNYGTDVLKASDELAKARVTYAGALKAQTEAQNRLLKAETKLASAAEAKDAADQNLREKTDILAMKLENLQKAKDTHNLALVNLAIAQADYERFKPQDSHSAPAASYEKIETAADAGSLGDVIVTDFSESSSRKVVFAKRCSLKYFLENSASFIRGCRSSSLTIDCSDLSWFSFNKKTLAALQENPDLSLTIIFTYNGRKYTFTIPAGYDLNLLQDANGWYGFMYLKMVFGGKEII